nr:ATPase WRNIP1-like isoform X2 [Cherax quadricarinatus]
MATLGLSKVFILDKYFTELQKFWETEKKLQDACGTSEAAQLEQRLRSLGCELVTLRSRLPPTLHHPRPTTPPTPATTTTTTNNNNNNAATTSANSFHTTNNNNSAATTTASSSNTSATTTTITTTTTTTTTTTATNNNKNAQNHNIGPLLPPNFPVGNGTSAPPDARLAPNTALSDALNTSQSFLAGKSVVVLFIRKLSLRIE